MSFRGLYSLRNHTKDEYTVRRPNIDSIIERDAPAPAPKTRQTVGRHEGSGGSRLNHASSEPMEFSAGGGQRSLLSPRTKRLDLGSRVLRRLFCERADVLQDNNSHNILPPTQSQFPTYSPASSMDEGETSIRTRTEQRRDAVVEEPCGLPPPYAQGPALPSYEIVIEEERRRIRSLRRKTLDHASNTATSWCRPSFPSAFFDRQQIERRQSRLGACE